MVFLSRLADKVGLGMVCLAFAFAFVLWLLLVPILLPLLWVYGPVYRWQTRREFRRQVNQHLTQWQMNGYSIHD